VLNDFKKTEAELLNDYLQQLTFGDATNREGHAAKVYFNALFGKDFSRSADISINAALNYGYSIILSSFTREIVSNGYITQLGLFHDNMFNQFNFASDLMEPFRPLVDRQVIYMNPQVFEHDEKMQLIAILNQEVFIDGRREYVNNAIKIYCRSVFDALNERDMSLLKFYEL
jgi:CRISPR-associated endonuclease Cas1 subtype II